jgi:hypothetical protein
MNDHLFQTERGVFHTPHACVLPSHANAAKAPPIRPNEAPPAIRGNGVPAWSLVMLAASTPPNPAPTNEPRSTRRCTHDQLQKQDHSRSLTSISLLRIR